MKDNLLYRMLKHTRAKSKKGRVLYLHKGLNIG